MRLSVNQGTFLKGIQTAMRAVDKKHPALSGILIEVNNSVTLTGSDTSKTIKITFDAQIEEGGTVLVPAKTLEDVIKRVGDTVELSTDGQKLNIKAGNAAFEILTIDIEYPVLPVDNREHIATIADETMLNLINKGGIAAARDGFRQLLNSVYLQFNDVKSVSTDGHRLALFETGINGPDCSYMVPSDTIQILSRVVGDKVDVYSAGQRLVFETGGTVLASNLIEGQYLPYDSVIPKECTCEVAVNKDYLLPALERALIMTNNSSFPNVRLRVSDKGINVFANSSEVGCMEEDVPTETYSGSDIDMSFNPNYLVDGLKAVDVGIVTLRFATTDKPVTITDNEGFTYIVMPVMTRED